MKIIRNPQFTAPVTVYEPADGSPIGRTFKVRFMAMSMTDQGEFDLTSAPGTSEFLRRAVVGWEGLTDEDDSTFEFSEDNLRLMVDLPWVRMALIQAYFGATSGIKAAKRGNS